MKVFIGADHRGFDFKSKIVNILKDQGHQIVDVGTDNNKESCDYPLFAYKVATSVAKSKNSRGILVCMSGIGQAIAANKIKGAYAALCYNVESAKFSRLHNNANILVLGAKSVKQRELSSIIEIWLNTEFEGGRHKKRFEMVKKMEKGLELK
ncbi:MAG: ribose 5-phosphate isomerase B [Candidatus Omnitrophica bacterium]|nr:ribose 5-phosphate isomerase B [Candidatus Omnitrophota bacterium]MBU1995722.1 ribose 5-phosphate isomerase B [Candidatus Omnitrophota bacterium]MBU4333692.1 ribose 5-phosphate isomerase B [Candidatus Omnitrophota bacterium]